MLDLGTLDQVKHYIKKQIEQTKDHICYGVDTTDKLHYSRGKLNALEVLLQDLKDLQKNMENVDDDSNT
jgi:trehalose-6-phosphate synthase